MIAFIEAISGGEPIYLIGNSMGGATAMGVTIARPDLIKKLVLMGAAGLGIANPDPAPGKALASYDYTPEGMRRLVGVLAGPYFDVSDELVNYRHSLTMAPGSRGSDGRRPGAHEDRRHALLRGGHLLDPGRRPWSSAANWTRSPSSSAHMATCA